jgi:hypothetical protein
VIRIPMLPEHPTFRSDNGRHKAKAITIRSDNSSEVSRAITIRSFQKEREEDVGT